MGPDIRALAEALALALAPAMPHVMKVGPPALDEVGKTLGGGAVEGLRKLWEHVRQKPAAVEAAEELAQAPEDARLLGALEFQLEKILKGDENLARELSRSFSSIQVYGDGAAASMSGVAAGKGGTAVGGNVHGGVTIVNIQSAEIRSPEEFWQAVGERRPAEDLTLATSRYLEHLVDRYRYLEFKGMGVTDRVALRLPLLDLYIPLKVRIDTPEGDTWAREVRVAGRTPTEEEMLAMGRRLSEPRPILNLLQRSSGLVVLGDPGAGKSTFLKFLTLTQASDRGEEFGLGPRLPVLLPLSAYADAIAEQDVALVPFLARYYQARGIELPLETMLRQALDRGGALLLFDGLDEVRDLHQRLLVVERVRDFYEFHRKAGNKFVLTSRIVGYREVRPEAEGLAECTLVDFDEEEIKTFVRKWTGAVERAVRGTTPVAGFEGERERADLLSSIRRNPGVRALAANPLLLTILALMKRQGVTLPEGRAQLFQTYVETLLRNWHLARSLSGRSGPGLEMAETLKILPPLALWMHETSPGVGLVKEGDLRRRLAEIFRERGNSAPEEATTRFLEDVRSDAALLLDRGGRQYGFIHQTFQEYLAAVALARRGQQGGGIVADALAAHVGEPAWHEVILLTIEYLGVVQQWEDVAGEVVEELIRRAPSPPGEAVILAGRAVAECGKASLSPSCRAKVVESLLVTVRAGGTVEAQRRVEAGRLLAELGDPRPEVMSLGGMEFCRVPPGPFRMGSPEQDPVASEDEKPLHTFDLPYGYWMGRYPVSVAQFREYVDASGRRPDEMASLAGWTSAPVWVSWEEAVGFCAWLTKSWRDRSLILPDFEVSLPSEPEWEKAARGGLEIPVLPCVQRLGPLGAESPLRANPDPERRFPWGNEEEPERANFAEGKIGDVNTIGCFPGGASPYGCEEMSGNVWEWTRSLWGRGFLQPTFGYPYQAADGREDLSESAKGLRVLRGGSCFDGAYSSRCACRLGGVPFGRDGDIGFRVVLSPGSS